jgi:ornithine decarboxylase
MQSFYKERRIKDRQKELFQRRHFPPYALSPYEAHIALVRNQGELVPMGEIEGRTALEGALPYPPGILAVIPGERWTSSAQQYFSALVDSINEFPGFAPELQGVYIEEIHGKKEAFGYVLKQST